MGRRRQDDEVAFGSDSFLDIVANIVGILIILIVIAGVRVSQMPAVAESTSDEAAPPPPVEVVEPAALVSQPSTPEPVQPMAAREPVPSPPPPPVPQRPPVPREPPPELVRDVERAQGEIAQLDDLKRRLAGRLHDAVRNAEEIGQQIAHSEAALDRDRGAAENGRQVVAALQTEVETKQRAIAGLHLELAETEAEQPPPEVIRHKLTPLGKTVAGEERHFLLSKNRVAVVPVADLAEELKSELLRKRNQLIRGQTRVGTVGPVNGFTMEYVVERRAISLMDELRQGDCRRQSRGLRVEDGAPVHDRHGVAGRSVASLVAIPSRPANGGAGRDADVLGVS